VNDQEILTCAEQAAEWLLERGELRASRFCSRIRIRAADMEAWVDETEAVQRAFLARCGSRGQREQQPHRPPIEHRGMRSER
jgi:hypothetical protein